MAKVQNPFSSTVSRLNEIKNDVPGLKGTSGTDFKLSIADCAYRHQIIPFLGIWIVHFNRDEIYYRKIEDVGTVWLPVIILDY